MVNHRRVAGKCAVPLSDLPAPQRWPIIVALASSPAVSGASLPADPQELRPELRRLRPTGLLLSNNLALICRRLNRLLRRLLFRPQSLSRRFDRFAHLCQQLLYWPTTLRRFDEQSLFQLTLPL